MQFNSLVFLIFFPAVTIIYFLLPLYFRLGLLLISSLIFYSYIIPAYTLILIGITVIDYFLALKIEKSKKYSKVYLLFGIIGNCLPLFIFKYFNFFNANLSVLANFFDLRYSAWTLKLILPLGLSFYTFQSISYLIEVFTKRQKAEKNLLIYTLYVSFYPKLIAGPIERPQHMIHQFYEKHYFVYQRIVDGLRLMLWGFFKKIVIADRLAVVVNQVYSDPQGYKGFPLILATVFFTYQIYCDFSGYTDIARGSAMVMGFDLVENFNKPYYSTSVSEFWRKWHISLSSWIRDYLYYPLAFNWARHSKKRLYLSLLITFIVVGLWHGANWTFVVFGAIQGIALIIENIGNRKLINWMPKMLRHIYFLAVLFVSFIFFRANNMKDALYIIVNLFTGLDSLFISLVHFDISGLINNLVQKGLGYSAPQDFILVLFSIIFLEIIQLAQKDRSFTEMISQKKTLFRWSVYYLLILSILIFGVFNQTQFIYFKF